MNVLYACLSVLTLSLIVGIGYSILLHLLAAFIVAIYILARLTRAVKEIGWYPQSCSKSAPIYVRLECKRLRKEWAEEVLILAFGK